LADRLRQWRGEVRGPLEVFQIEQTLAPTWDLQNDDVSFHFEGQRGDTVVKVEPRSALRAWQRGETLFPLPGGGFAPLPSDWLQRFGTRILAFLDQREPENGVPKAAALTVARLLEDDGIEPPPTLARLRDHLQSIHGDDLPLP